MRKRLSWILILIIIVALIPAYSAIANEFKPNPKTSYAASFVQKCDEQTWFLDEVERLLNLEQKTINTLSGPSDLNNIKALGFKDANITGIIPTAIGEFQELRYLWLPGNNLTGSIPDELYALPNLQEVDLAENNYSGPIPVEFGTMASLKVLNIKGNAFSGSIPETILNNAQLSILNLGNNQLSGNIPIVNNMTGLEYLNLSKNNWGGSLPDFTGMTSLVALSAWDCNLTGSLPSSLFSLVNLQVLDLAYNGLTGEIPVEIGTLTDLQFLSLSTNKLTGELPDTLEDLYQLQELNLANNLLRGTIPDAFGADTLIKIHLENNFLRGHVPQTLKDRYDDGATVYLQNNYLTGDLLKSMPNNEKNFTDNAATEQYQLTANQYAVQVSKTGTGTNVYSMLFNQSKTTGNSTQKIRLNPDEYEVIYDDSKVEVVVNSDGIFVKALEDILIDDNLTIEIRIRDNTGSDYSKLVLQVTTGTVPAGGGNGNGSGGDAGGIGKKPPLHEYHAPYILGYPDKSFQPEGNISREEVVTMIIRALEIEPGGFNVSTYSDVSTERWSYLFIEEANERSFVNGYPDGMFMPGNPITRAEFATVLVRIAKQQGIQAANEENIFADVKPDAWYYDEVMYAAKLGITTGYPDGSFRSENTLTRAEAVTMLNRFLGRDPNCSSVKKIVCPFDDVKTNHWAYGQIIEASMEHGAD